MADPPPSRDPAEAPGVRPDRGSTGMPRWVKVSLIIAIVLALAFLITRLAGVQHGPGLHDPSGGGRGHAPTMGVEQP